MNEDDTNKSAVELEMGDAGKNADTAPPFFFSLVVAEVIFSSTKGVGTHRVQLFSKADTPNFPAARLAQVQNSAAHMVKEQVPNQEFKALEVVLLNILPLGCMTDEHFWGSQEAIPGPAPVVVEEPKAASMDGVLPFKRP